MARFPTREADIRALARNIIAGLDGNPDFPNPPVAPAELQALLDNSIAQEEAQVEAYAAAQQATEAKHEGNRALISAMKTVLHYSEDVVGRNDAKLAALGWGGRAEPTPLQVPGQPRSLESAQEGAGWVALDWKRSSDGGREAFYRVERRKASNGEWKIAGMAVEYRVIAVKRASRATR